MGDMRRSIWRKIMYVLHVEGKGIYSEDTLLRLFLAVIRHRFHHLIKGEGWTD